LQAAGVALQTDDIDGPSQEQMLVALVTGRHVPRRARIPGNRRFVKKALQQVQIAVADGALSNKVIETPLTMSLARIEAEGRAAGGPLDSVPHTRLRVRECSLSLDAFDRAAAASHPGQPVRVGYLFVTGGARRAAGVTVSRRTDRGKCGGGNHENPHPPPALYPQKSNLVPIWPVRLPLALVTCPNSGLVIVVLIPPS